MTRLGPHRLAQVERLDGQSLGGQLVRHAVLCGDRPHQPEQRLEGRRPVLLCSEQQADEMGAVTSHMSLLFGSPECPDPCRNVNRSGRMPLGSPAIHVHTRSCGVHRQPLREHRVGARSRSRECGGSSRSHGRGPVVGRAARRRGSCCSQRDTGPACCRRPGRGARPADPPRHVGRPSREAFGSLAHLGVDGRTQRRGRHVRVVRDVKQVDPPARQLPTMRPPCRARSACTTGTGSSARSAMRARSRRRTESVLVVGSPGRCGRWRSGARLPWPRRSRRAPGSLSTGAGSRGPSNRRLTCPSAGSACST